MKKTPTITVHTAAETAAYVAKLRAEGLLPPRGQSHEWAKPADTRTVTTSSRVEPVSDIGDRVQVKFSKLNVSMSAGCSCESVRRDMNSKTADEVMEKIDHFVNSTFANVKHMEGLIGFSIKAFASIASGMAKKRIRGVIVEACDEWRLEKLPPRCDVEK